MILLVNVPALLAKLNVAVYVPPAVSEYVNPLKAASEILPAFKLEPEIEKTGKIEQTLKSNQNIHEK